MTTPIDAELRRQRIRAWIQIALGVALTTAGGIVTWLTYSAVAETGGTYYVWRGGIVSGVLTILHGIWRLMAAYERPDERTPSFDLGDQPAVSLTSSFGYKSFVAWRYLLERRRRIRPWVQIAIPAALVVRCLFWLILGDGLGEERIRTWQGSAEIATWLFIGVVMFWGVLRFSKPAMFVFLTGAIVGIGCGIAGYILRHNATSIGAFELEETRPLLQSLGIAALAGWAVAGLAMFFGTVRAIFTFFTTVPIGGVWIGTAALVCVLSVMSGFESDLREKILGSNAHMQITKEDGDFVEWKDVKARIDKIPGVVASTPYAVSEVVIAANNNGMNVIIKGIDPKTVGKVTDLISDLEESDAEARQAAMKRLEPLIDDSHDRSVPQDLPAKRSDLVDPPPADMPNSGEPIDFSSESGSAGSGSGAGSGSAAPTGAHAGPAGDPDVARIHGYGGDAPIILGTEPETPPSTVVDPPPPDLAISHDTPEDFSGSDTLYRDESVDSAIRVIEPFDGPILTRRTQSLPGILVGRELVKQTHLYTGEEVRVVSPLSDPANPDATGTPIPFNRDYRVAGVFYTGMYEYDLKYVYVTLDSLSEFLDRGDTVDGIEIRIEDPDETDAFVARISHELGPSYRVVDWKELNRSLFSALKLEKIAMFLVLGIVILVASFSIVGNLIMVVIEKAREIALLKTLGASDWGVMQLFAIQGLMIGLFGTVLGVLTGLLGCWAGKRFGLPLNPDVYYIDRLPIHVDPNSVIAAAAAGILISITATLYPALLAAHVRPAAGMRH